jgi:hypothetical protein
MDEWADPNSSPLDDVRRAIDNARRVAFVVVDVGIEIVEELPVEECPTCGHMSVAAAMAALTLNGVAQNVGKYTRCAEGCDDDPILVEGHDPDD